MAAQEVELPWIEYPQTAATLAELKTVLYDLDKAADADDQRRQEARNNVTLLMSRIAQRRLTLAAEEHVDPWQPNSDDTLRQLQQELDVAIREYRAKETPYANGVAAQLELINERLKGSTDTDAKKAREFRKQQMRATRATRAAIEPPAGKSTSSSLRSLKPGERQWVMRH